MSLKRWAQTRPPLKKRRKRLSLSQKLTRLMPRSRPPIKRRRRRKQQRKPQLSRLKRKSRLKNPLMKPLRRPPFRRLLRSVKHKLEDAKRDPTCQQPSRMQMTVRRETKWTRMLWIAEREFPSALIVRK